MMTRMCGGIMTRMQLDSPGADSESARPGGSASRNHDHHRVTVTVPALRRAWELDCRQWETRIVGLRVRA